MKLRQDGVKANLHTVLDHLVAAEMTDMEWASYASPAHFSERLGGVHVEKTVKNHRFELGIDLFRVSKAMKRTKKWAFLSSERCGGSIRSSTSSTARALGLYRERPR